MKKNKKGFTLVELSVVIALIGIIVSMAVTFIATYYQQVYRLEGDKNTIYDLSEVQRITRQWIAYYDDYNSNIVSVDSEDGFSKLKTSGGAQLYFDPAAKRLYWIDSGTHVKESYDIAELTGLHFSSITNGEDTDDPSLQNRTKMVICTAEFGDGITQDLYFAVFTGIQRFRYINPGRVKS